jgi:hypothetical protein
VLDRWYTDRFDPAYATETGHLFQPDVVAPVETWLRDHVTKLLLLGPPPHLSAIADRIRAKFAHQAALVQTEPHLLQIMHATVSKAQALRVVAGELKVPRERVMAIGDNANDVGMIQWAGLGVAVGNATPEARAAAAYVTDRHDEDGAAKAVQRFVLDPVG